MTPVPNGEAGELCVAGEGLARGYLNREALTADRFVFSSHPQLAGTRLYRTGDLVRSLSDGNIEFLGRIDNQIKIRGFRVEPEEVEAALARHAEVRQAVAVARELSIGDKQLIAFVVPDRDGRLDVCALRRQLEETLPEYMVPAFIFSMSELPLTPNGKVDRAALIKSVDSQPEERSTFAAPATGTERTISAILGDILQMRSVGADDKFFDLGANSLQLTSLHSRLETALNRELRITSLFQNPTVRSLARSLDQKDNAETFTEGVQARATRQRAAFGMKRQIRVEETET
jgi:hypothetical protein